jgi:hypothetical protein
MGMSLKARNERPKAKTGLVRPRRKANLKQGGRSRQCGGSFTPNLRLLSGETAAGPEDNVLISRGYEMSDAFKDREKAAEAKWAHDEETRFKVNARRNKLLGLWAAGEMGITGPAADDYAKEVVKADFEEEGTEDVVRKVLKDFQAKGMTLSDHAIRKRLEELQTVAVEQVVKEGK